MKATETHTSNSIKHEFKKQITLTRKSTERSYTIHAKTFLFFVIHEHTVKHMITVLIPKLF